MYDSAKPKRKREDVPSIGDYLLSAVAGLGRAGFASARLMWRGVVQSLRWSWYGTRWGLRGAGYSLAFSAGILWEFVVWTLRLPLRMMRGLWRWWSGPEPYFESARERDIYYRIRRHFRRRRRFTLHIIAYLAINSAFWLQWYNMSSSPYPPRALNYAALTVVTSFFLLFHYLHLRSAEAEEQAIEEALERERFYASQHAMAYDEGYDPAYMRLVDDGEIVDERYIEEERKRKRR